MYNDLLHIYISRSKSCHYLTIRLDLLQVYVDLAYTIDIPTAKKITKVWELLTIVLGCCYFDRCLVCVFVCSFIRKSNHFAVRLMLMETSSKHWDLMRHLRLVDQYVHVHAYLYMCMHTHTHNNICTQYCNNTANVTTVTEDLVRVRQKVYEMMKDTQLTAVIFNQVS